MDQLLLDNTTTQRQTLICFTALKTVKFMIEVGPIFTTTVGAHRDCGITYSEEK